MTSPQRLIAKQSNKNTRNVDLNRDRSINRNGHQFYGKFIKKYPKRFVGDACKEWNNWTNRSATFLADFGCGIS